MDYKPKTYELYAYALLIPGRDPYYLPLTLRPGGAGEARNVTLDQPPGSEKTFILGDGMRKIEPLTLSGTLARDVFEDMGLEPTEDAARLLLSEIDQAARLATGVQRGQSVTRGLHALGWLSGKPGETPLDWELTITLYPVQAGWTDTITGINVPF